MNAQPALTSVGGTPDAPGVPPNDVRTWRRQIIASARVVGWRSALVPRRTIQDTADTSGFPELVLVHGGAGRIWFVKLRRDGVGSEISKEAALWGETIIAAGGVWRLVRCPSGLDDFRADLADSVRPI